MNDTGLEIALTLAAKRIKRRKPKETCKREVREQWGRRCLMLMAAGVGGSSGGTVPANGIIDLNSVLVVDLNGVQIVGQ